jgi:hypothetical protein
VLKLELTNNTLGCWISAASGEPPLLLASSVHCAMREAIRAARKEFWVCTGPANSPLTFQMDVPATMPVVKERVSRRRNHRKSIDPAGRGRQHARGNLLSTIKLPAEARAIPIHQGDVSACFARNGVTLEREYSI